jgi:hypothetical protein
MPFTAIDSRVQLFGGYEYMREYQNRARLGRYTPTADPRRNHRP